MTNVYLIAVELTAGAFNQLNPHISSPGCRTYCNAELAVFSLLIAR